MTNTNVQNSVLVATDMQKLFKIKDELNVVIKELGYPVLEGMYFVKEDFMPEEERNYVIDFNDGGKADFYAKYERAKFRSCGRFEG